MATKNEIIEEGFYERTPENLRAAQLYELAHAEYRLELAQTQWLAAGQPLLALGSTGQFTEHPLMKIMRDLERHVIVLRDALRAKQNGPEPSAVLKGSVPKSRSARLRAVNG